MTHRITASLIAGSALTTLTATGALAHAVPEIGQARTAVGQTAPALVGMGRAAATPVAATPAASGVQMASGPMDFMGTLSRGNASTNTSINRSSCGSRNSSSNTSSHSLFGGAAFSNASSNSSSNSSSSSSNWGRGCRLSSSLAPLVWLLLSCALLTRQQGACCIDEPPRLTMSHCAA
jgi:hypothetical protein